MIYFDNAATTRNKPEQVLDAYTYYLKKIGVSPGRGSYSLGIEASRMLYQVRKKVGMYFDLENSTNVVFTKNSTEAINMFFNGFLKTGDHVVISCYEHNAVLRPLQHLKDVGRIDYTVIKREDIDLDAEELIEKYCQKNTRVMALTLASNITGRIVYRSELFREAKKKSIVTFLDASQGAGIVPVSMKKDAVDYLAFTGHKDLLGLPGVGGLCCREREEIEPLIQGGTGIFGNEYVNPKAFPEGLEAGTINMPAIWAMGCAIDYCMHNRTEFYAKEQKLMKMLLNQLQQIENVVIYDLDCERVSTVGFNIKGHTSDEVVKYLDDNDICVRGGIHCAILTHESLNTVQTGIVRISLSPFSTEKEISDFVEIIKSFR